MSKSVGLALGGGGTRGFAHIGVLQVLEENKIPIDYIAGTSMGSVIGGIYACGTDLHMLERIVPELNEKDYKDIQIPRYGFLKGAKLQELIRIFTKRYDFEQAHIPLRCVAVDALSGQKVEIGEGQIDDAIRASIAVPVIFEPVRWKDRLLLDGGIVERIPIQTARNMGADIVIAVDVGYRGGSTADTDPVHMMDYFMMTIDMMGWTAVQYQEKEADMVIVPDVARLDMASFRDFEISVQRGREAAEAALPDIQKQLKKRTRKPRTKKTEERPTA